MNDEALIFLHRLDMLALDMCKSYGDTSDEFRARIIKGFCKGLEKYMVNRRDVALFPYLTYFAKIEIEGKEAVEEPK